MNLINTDAFVGKVEKDLGDLGEAKLYVEEDAKPVVLPARKIPIAIQGQVKQELDKLVERGILVPVKEPTEWVNQMAVVRKSSGCLRICLDTPTSKQSAEMSSGTDLPHLMMSCQISTRQSCSPKWMSKKRSGMCDKIKSRASSQRR